MSRIKVVHFIETLYQGGAETLVKDYALLLDRSKFDVAVVCLRKTGSPYENLLKNAGVTVFYISDFFGSKKSIWGKIKNKIANCIGLYHLKVSILFKEIRPDVIHAHLAVLRYLKFAQSQISASLFYTVHGEPARYWNSGKCTAQKELFACKWLLENSGMRLVALHDKMKNELNALFGVENTIVLNNGIDFNRFIVDESREEIRRTLGISESCFLVGHVGRFVKEKNHSLLVDAFYELRKKKKECHLILVGVGELKAMIKQKIEKLNLMSYVTMLDSRADIPRIMNAMDVFAFPSVSEGLGIVLIEAQKMQTKCVISSAVPEAAVVSNLVCRMKDSATAVDWADALMNFKVDSVVYKNIEDWDMKNVIKKLQGMYSGSFEAP